MRRFAQVLLIVGLTIASFANEVIKPFVSPLFGDNMVLQRGKPNTIWGRAKPGAVVQVKIGGPKAEVVAKVDGRRQVELQIPSTGGPYILAISSEQTVTFTNILVGDVWLCGGQSNMEFPLSRVCNGDAVVKAADQPQIRLFNIKQQPAFVAKQTCPSASSKIVGAGRQQQFLDPN